MHTALRPLVHALRLAAMAGAALVGVAAQAALVDRGGGLIYDTVLDITWLQDANYAATQRYSLLENGGLTWANALAWADQLVYYDAVRNKYWSDWRLPGVEPLDPSKGWQKQVSTQGDQDDGYNISAPGTKYAGSTASELAHLYYNSLGNTAKCPPTGGFADCSNEPYTSYTLKTGPFVNFVKEIYWTDSNDSLTQYPDAWAFDTKLGWGLQGAFNAGVPHPAWAVMEGDVGLVPEPSTFMLMGSALVVVGGAAWRRRRASNAA